MKILLFALAIIGASNVSADNISVKTSLESAYIIMGKKTHLHIEILENNDANGNLLINNEEIDTIITPIEINDRLKSDTVDLGNNRRQIVQDIIIQSFDSGLYTIPPIVYIADNETIKSNSLVLKVLPVDVDSMATIHGQAQTISPIRRWYDFLPDFITDNWGWLLLALLLIAGGIIGTIFYIKYRQNKISIPFIPKKIPTPPHILALQQLSLLKEEKLCEKGQEKEFYTRLTDILRTYIDSRFNINAMEMTSSQIIEALKYCNDTQTANQYMKQILEIADFVKFAKVRPLPEDNNKSFNWATQFIEDTKPVEINAETDEVAAAKKVELNNNI